MVSPTPARDHPGKRCARNRSRDAAFTIQGCVLYLLPRQGGPILVLGSPVPVPVPVTNKLMQAADIASFLRAQRPAFGIRDS